jgi:hypothetical protein
MASIRTLQQLTGTTLGYDYTAPEWQRREQIQTWVDWYNRQKTPQSPSQPAPAASPPSAPAQPPSQPSPGNADTV